MNRAARIVLGAERAAAEGPQGLLRRERKPGYPVEYVLSRVRGRRSRLIQDWRPLIHESPLDHLASPQYQGFVRERTPEGMWRALLLEHGWVQGQMDEAARRVFAPYLLYAELRTLFISLRGLQGGKAQKADEVLGVSLLSDEVRAVLREGAVADAVAGLETIFSGLSPDFAGLSAAYGDQGLREVERVLTHRYLSFVLPQPLHPVMRGFFARIIDSRNILALYKSLRSGEPGPARFLDGGLVAVERLRALREQENFMEMRGLIRQATGLTIASPEPTQVEVALYRGITRFLREAGRDPLDEALLLDYLWRCQIEVMNLSLLLAGRDLERDEAAAELVK